MSVTKLISNPNQPKYANRRRRTLAKAGVNEESIGPSSTNCTNEARAVGVLLLIPTSSTNCATWTLPLLLHFGGGRILNPKPLAIAAAARSGFNRSRVDLALQATSSRRTSPRDVSRLMSSRVMLLGAKLGHQSSWAARNTVLPHRWVHVTSPLVGRRQSLVRSIGIARSTQFCTPKMIHS